MSGHSKWATIKRKKGATDAKRGKLFAKLVRVVEVAARQGGGNPDSNPALATAIDKARAASVPIDNIERAIKRGTGEVEGVTYEEMWYEGYGPGGVALYVQVLTENRNRAASEVRSAFTRSGGNLGEPGSVAYMFEQKAWLVAEGDEERITLAALDAEAEDVRPSGDGFEVIGAPGHLDQIRRGLEAVGVKVESAEVTQLAKIDVPVSEAFAGKLLRLVETLEDLDDVQAVYTNADLPESTLAEIS